MLVAVAIAVLTLFTHDRCVLVHWQEITGLHLAAGASADGRAVQPYVNSPANRLHRAEPGASNTRAQWGEIIARLGRRSET